ncbi:hypothetical protein SMB93_003540 [Cronobacter sakazakii]|nr:hypothetical protein [Cronobacter sakazakii]
MVVLNDGRVMRGVDIAAVAIATTATAHQVPHQQAAEEPAVIVIVDHYRSGRHNRHGSSWRSSYRGRRRTIHYSGHGWLIDDYRRRAVTVARAERNQGKQHATSNQQMFLFHP